MSKQLKPYVGDASSVRPSSRRTQFEYADQIGVYDLANGLTVHVLWIPTDGQHHHIIVWDGPGGSILRTEQYVVTANAGRVTERILRELEP